MEDAHLLLSPQGDCRLAAVAGRRRRRVRSGGIVPPGPSMIAWTRKHGEVHNGGHRDAFVALATKVRAPPMATRRVQSDKREKRRREEEEESSEETKKRSPDAHLLLSPQGDCRLAAVAGRRRRRVRSGGIVPPGPVDGSARSKLTTPERKGGSMDPGYTSMEMAS
uniref:Uncharacterized protein n=1 Tax=Oryza meridionalis TaxID=40149 RepID=A0A0E0F3Y7_9ORYZ